MAANAGTGESHSKGKELRRDHHRHRFFIIAYAFSWIVWAPWVLSEDGVGLLPVELGSQVPRFLVPAGLLAGPFLSAFIMTATTERREGVRRLLGRFVLWRVGIRWYLFALLGVPLIMVLGAMVYTMSLPNLGALGGPSYLLTYLGLFVLVFLFGGPLLEEPGWRGFALPRMERLHGPLLASLILGVLWSLWHVPLFVLSRWSSESGGGGGLLNIALYVVGVMLLSLVFTWVFNNTQTSILLAILVHTSNNVFAGTLAEIFPAEAVASGFPQLIGFGVTALVLIVLTRGRLDYRKYRQEVEPDPATAPTT